MFMNDDLALRDYTMQKKDSDNALVIMQLFHT